MSAVRDGDLVRGCRYKPTTNSFDQAQSQSQTSLLSFIQIYSLSLHNITTIVCPKNLSSSTRSRSTYICPCQQSTIHNFSSTQRPYNPPNAYYLLTNTNQQLIKLRRLILRTTGLRLVLHPRLLFCYCCYRPVFFSPRPLVASVSIDGGLKLCIHPSPPFAC